jgi:hypothetical protein
MNHRFRKHYTREEARSLLPQVREWLARLVDTRDRLSCFDERLGVMLADGQDLGGEAVNGWLVTLAEFRTTMREFEDREVQVKDLDRGLVDFPALMKGREVFLCWELGEDDVEHWHELDGGFAGREPFF